MPPKGHPFPGANGRKNKHRRKGSSKHNSQKDALSLPPSKKDRVNRPPALRGIADEIVISSNALKRIFMVTGLAGLCGGKLDRMKKAMDLAVASRIKIHDLLGPGGENVGVWLEVSDVIREMIMSANGRPGVDYAIVLTGDGR